MRIMTCNVNGIRSAYAKGFWDWLLKQKFDVVCLQETRAFEEQLPPAMLKSKKFHSYLHPAEKPGYSGVAIYSAEKPDNVQIGIGNKSWDKEGRYLQADFGNLSVISLYLPSGSSGDVRQTKKYEVMDIFYKHLRKLNKKNREIVICGDFNIAHKQIDIKNWKSNQKNSGFLPEERAWLDKVFGNLGYVDAFRVVNQKEEQYTWWSNRGRAYQNNVGWRIDYQVVSENLKEKIQSAKIYKTKKFSDHAPLILDYA